MTDKSEDLKRQSLASELADVILRQRLLAEAGAALALALPDASGQRLATVVELDRGDLRLLESAVSNFGVRVEPKPTTRRIAELTAGIAAGDVSSMLERVLAYSALRDQQTRGVRLLQRAVRLAKVDIKGALAPLAAVQARLAKHSAAAQALLDDYGVELVMGEPPAQGLVGRVRGASAAVVSAVAVRVVRPNEELSLPALLRADHAKLRVLFRELDGETDSRQAQGLFRQLRDDLRAHSLAEERVAYERFRLLDPGRHDLARSEHEVARSLLEEIDALPPGSAAFRERLLELETLVTRHVEREEGELFGLWRAQAGRERLVEMSRDFLAAKQAVQEERHIRPPRSTEMTT